MGAFSASIMPEGATLADLIGAGKQAHTVGHNNEPTGLGLEPRTGRRLIAVWEW